MKTQITKKLHAVKSTVVETEMDGRENLKMYIIIL